VVLPVDHMICDQFNESSSYNSSLPSQMLFPAGKFAIDIVPKTIQNYISCVKSSKTILINGPLAVF